MSGRRGASGRRSWATSSVRAACSSTSVASCGVVTSVLTGGSPWRDRGRGRAAGWSTRDVDRGVGGGRRRTRAPARPKVSRVSRAAIRPIRAYGLNSSAGPTQPNFSVQQGGDERGEAGHHGRDLVGQRGAGGAAGGGEQLREPTALSAGEGVLGDGVGDHDGQPDEDHDPGVGEREHPTPQRMPKAQTARYCGSAADLVGQRGPAQGGADADGGGDAQRQRGSGCGW